ncbi:MAG: YkgJ family cysteine cluster protein [Candidatus Kapaibacterium sp.]
MDLNTFKEKVVQDYPRLKKDGKFKFGCHPGVSCFNKCCNDVNIFLTPYDIIRLKNRLGISSGEFLEKYTILPLEENLRHPIVMLRMNEGTMDCPFVDAEKGCTLYEDRPWSCRMFPVGVASPDEITSEKEEEFFFLLKEKVCRGFEEGQKEWTVAEWMDDQKVQDYNEFGELFKKISMHDRFTHEKPLEPVKLEMFFMVCYDIDKFRDFVFGSSFLTRFDIEDEQINKMKESDSELLRFGFKWLRLSLFGEKTMTLRPEYINPNYVA